MTAAKRIQRISVEDYLAGELVSPVKHEYLNGTVHAMAGARNRHNDIVGNVFAGLHVRLQGTRCRAYNSDTKVRIRLANDTRFYYPDSLATCDRNPGNDSYQDQPVVIFEVLSKSTRRVDMVEKKDAYLQIPSLRVYVLVESDAPMMFVYRRVEDRFEREEYVGEEAVLPLNEIGVSLPLANAYADISQEIEEADGDDGE